MTARLRFRCHTCGNEWKAWAPAERHAHAEHGRRIEVVIDDKLGVDGAADQG